MVDVEILWDGNRMMIAHARDWEWAHRIVEGLIYSCGWEVLGNEGYVNEHHYYVYDPVAECDIEVLLSLSLSE